jgi:hypothetical protein
MTVSARGRLTTRRWPACNEMLPSTTGPLTTTRPCRSRSSNRSLAGSHETVKTVPVTEFATGRHSAVDDFRLVLSSPTGATLGDSSGTAKLTNRNGLLSARVTDTAVVRSAGASGVATVTVSGNTVRDVRLERMIKSDDSKTNWSWYENPFVGTRELNGLKVMMALINNWDLKAGNNAIYQIGRERQYRVTDLGATFGDCNCWTRSKADLAAYRKAKFLRKVSAEDVDLRLPSAPWLFAFAFPFYIQRTRVSSIAEDLPIQNVEWIGRLLAQLTTRQISDAFRAGGFQPSAVEGSTQEVQKRISELRRLN